MKLSISAVAVFALFVAGAARAEQDGGPCRADAEKFCKDIKPGDGRLIDCLKKHEAELSVECKAKDLEVQENGKALAGACAGDLDKFCKDVKGGHGGKLLCLKKHKKKLSKDCKAGFAKRKEEKRKKNPCLADLEKFCKDVKPGKGRLTDCLKAHEAGLSEACKAKQAGKKKSGNERKKEKREHSGAVKDGGGDKPEAANKPE